MIDEDNARRYCCEDISKIENYDKAINDTETWECHHRGEILPCGRYTVNDLIQYNLYWHRPARELIFMTKAEHRAIHRRGVKMSKSFRDAISQGRKGMKFSAEHRANMSKVRKGKINPMLRELNKGNQHAIGHKVSEETKRRWSEQNRKRRWWRKGNECVFREEPPDSTWVSGRVGWKKQ